jgi:hypothetical protein
MLEARKHESFKDMELESFMISSTIFQNENREKILGTKEKKKL